MQMTHTAMGENGRKKNVPLIITHQHKKSLSLSPGVFCNYSRQQSKSLQQVTVRKAVYSSAREEKKKWEIK